MPSDTPADEDITTTLPPDPLRAAVDQRRLDRQNLAAFVVILGLIAGGVYLMDLMQKSYQMELCLERGRHDCGRVLDR